MPPEKHELERGYDAPQRAPLPPAERARLDALIARIPDEPESTFHRDLTAELRGIVGADAASSFRPEFVPELGWITDYAYFHHPTLGAIPDAIEQVRAWLGGVGEHELSPIFPMTERHANRALHCTKDDVATWTAHRYAAVSAAAQIPEAQVGAGLVERGVMLGYVGLASSTDAFTPWAGTALDAVLPALRRRLAVDLRLREARVLTHALEAALDLVELPAFVLVGRRVIHANALGRAWSDRDATALRAVLDASLDGAPDAALACDVRRVPGLPPVVIAVQRRPESDARLERFASAHRLSARERDVVAQVASGHANKTIASHLRCTVKNVEALLTSVFRKTGCESRTELIARLLHQAA